MKVPLGIFAEYWKWRKNWDGLCVHCGQCCYSRSFSAAGEIVIDHTKPCEFLEEETLLCSVFENRFRECSRCKSVNLFRALFNPLLPPNCAYAQTFRLWLR